MLKQRIVISFFFPALFLVSCGRPSWVLSEKQMENVLFDIHIADAEINDSYLDFRNEKQKQELYASVLKKHGVTREQFDTSLVWYGKNLSKYLEIYDKIGKRYAVLSDSLNARIDRQRMLTISSDSNRIYVWKYPKTFMLTSFAGQNMFSFNIDTIQLSQKKQYEFIFSTLGINDTITAPWVILGVEFPDSVVIKRRKIIENGLITIPISFTDSVNPSRFFGSIRITPQKGNEKKAVFYNMGLCEQANLPASLSNEFPIP